MAHSVPPRPLPPPLPPGFTYFHPFSPIFTCFHLFSPVFNRFHPFSTVFTRFHLFVRGLGKKKCTGATIRTRQEIECLPYAWWKENNVTKVNYQLPLPPPPSFTHGPTLVGPWSSRHPFRRWTELNIQEQTCLQWSATVDRNKHVCKTLLQFKWAIGII